MSALNAIQSNAARLTQRLQESISESTRDLSFGPSTSGDYHDATDDRVAQIKKGLDSNSEREKLEALKKLIAMISKQLPVSSFFPRVVKLVASPSLQVRKLVYIYLLRYAHLEPDLALLSINTFQKDLADPNPLIRAMALRVLSSIGGKVPMIAGVVRMAVNKCITDPSPYVRKTAALALIKCFEADPSPTNYLSALEQLLSDTSPLSLGTIALAYLTISPDSYGILHKHYRRYCRTLPDLDSWGQVNMSELLGRYARSMLTKPSDDPTKPLDPDLSLLLTSSKPLLYSRNAATILSTLRLHHFLSPPLSPSTTDPGSEPFHVQPLLTLLNSPSSTRAAMQRVVLSYILSLALQDPAPWTQPTVWRRFILKATDNAKVKELKMSLLLCIVRGSAGPDGERGKVLAEFMEYINDSDPATVRRAIQALGICALRGRVGTGSSGGDIMMTVTKVLLRLLSSQDENTTSTAVRVLLSLVQYLSSPESNVASRRQGIGIVAKLARLYLAEKLESAKARAGVLWIVGEYGEDEAGDTGTGITTWAPDVLRIGARRFIEETTYVKLQTVTLASKLAVIIPSSPSHPTSILVLQLTSYIFALALLDPSYGVRDRARFLATLVSGAVAEVRGGLEQCMTKEKSSWDDVDSGDTGFGIASLTNHGGVTLRREQVKLVLVGGKKGGSFDEEQPHYPAAPFGSLSQVLDRDMAWVDPNVPLSGSETEGIGLNAAMRLSGRYPEWCEEGSDPSLRNSMEEKPPTPVVTAISSTTAARFVSGNTKPGNVSPQILAPSRGHSPASSFQQRKANWTDLDTFYASSESNETVESEEIEEIEEEEGSEEEDDEDDEEMEHEENDELLRLAPYTAQEQSIHGAIDPNFYD